MQETKMWGEKKNKTTFLPQESSISRSSRNLKKHHFGVLHLLAVMSVFSRVLRRHGGNGVVNLVFDKKVCSLLYIFLEILEGFLKAAL